MKKGVILFVTLLLFLLVDSVEQLAQEQREVEIITVSSSEVTNGVVILTAEEGRKAFELRCNKDISGCTVLEPGSYLMVRLPKNRGIYDCANVDIYRRSANSEIRDKLGEYCVIEAK
ncbi:MAG TPA: hypothetical protein VEV41_24920 [Terriglobales bacterium]|nr:hypothetical protein [Terriglobales bacterium]